jgi:hypothetical protein
MLAGKRVDLPEKPKLLPTDFALMGVCMAILIVLGIHIPSAFAGILQRALVVLQ